MFRFLATTTVAAALLFALASNGNAQMPPAKPVDAKILAQINEQVWIPFCESFGQNDSEAFLALHTADAVRISIDRNDVKSGADFHEQTAQRMQSTKDAGHAFTLTLRFTKRTHGEDAAFETGVYRFESKSSGYIGYGEFQVLLRKVDGTWKVALDADQSSNADAFEAARPLEDVEWD